MANFILLSSSGKSQSLEITGVYQMDQKARLFQAAKTGAIFFIVAIGCVLLPVVHFFLVPLFLILTPIMAFRAYNRHSVFPPFQLACPDCQKPIKINDRHVNFPLKVNCYECGARLEISTKVETTNVQIVNNKY